MSGNLISSFGASILFQTLKNENMVIEGLALDDNLINDSAMKALGDFLETEKSLNYIWLSDQRNEGITDEGIGILSKYFNANIKLKQLSLRGNRGITNSSIPILIDMIRNSQLELLAVERTSINVENVIRYHLELNKIKNGIPILRFNSLNLGDFQVAIICNFIKEYGANITHLE